MNIYPAVIRLGRLLFPRVAFDSRGIVVKQPAVFVSNHAGSFGPIALFLHLPFQAYPWIISDMMELDSCVRYLSREFLSGELKIPPPFDRYLARAIARFCIGLFHHIGAIPVYSQSHKILETLSRSIICLEDGKSLLIFPEIPHENLNEYIQRFNTGFIKIAKSVQEKNGSTVRIYPLAVNKKSRRIALGPPSQYDLAEPYLQEKRRIERELEATISALLKEES